MNNESTKTVFSIPNKTINVVKISGDGYECISVNDSQIESLCKSFSTINKWNEFTTMFKNLIKSIRVFLEEFSKLNITDDCDYAFFSSLSNHFLSDYYSLVEYGNKHFGDDWKKYLNNVYDSNFSYRFIYYYRVYCSHNNLGITQQNIKFDNGLFTMAIGLSKNDFIAFNGVKKIREEITNKYAENFIPVNLLIEEFKTVISSAFINYFVINSSELTNSMLDIIKFIPDYKIKPRDAFLKIDENNLKGLLKSLNIAVQICDKNIAVFLDKTNLPHDFINVANKIIQIYNGNSA